jgi:hypothetical protein
MFYAGKGAQPSAADASRLQQLAGGSADVGFYCERVLQVWTQPAQPGGFQGLPGYGPQGGQGPGQDAGNRGQGQGEGGNGGSGYGGQH